MCVKYTIEERGKEERARMTKKNDFVLIKKQHQQIMQDVKAIPG